MSLRLRVAGAVVGVVIVGTLGGCAFPSGASSRAMGLRLNADGSYSVALCESLMASQISVLSTQGESADLVLWTAAGKTSLPAGTVVTTGSAPNGMVEAVSFQREDDAQRRLVVEFTGSNRYRQALDEWQVFPQSDLRIGIWSWSASTDDVAGPCELRGER